MNGFRVITVDGVTCWVRRNPQGDWETAVPTVNARDAVFTTCPVADVSLTALGAAQAHAYFYAEVAR